MLYDLANSNNITKNKTADKTMVWNETFTYKGWCIVITIKKPK